MPQIYKRQVQLGESKTFEPPKPAPSAVKQSSPEPITLESPQPRQSSNIPEQVKTSKTAPIDPIADILKEDKSIPEPQKTPKTVKIDPEPVQISPEPVKRKKQKQKYSEEELTEFMRMMDKQSGEGRSKPIPGAKPQRKTSRLFKSSRLL